MFSTMNSLEKGSVGTGLEGFEQVGTWAFRTGSSSFGETESQTRDSKTDQKEAGTVMVPKHAPVQRERENLAQPWTP